MKHIAIFASGKGTNAEKIMEHFHNHASVKVALVITNNPASGVLAFAQKRKIISAIISKNFFENKEEMSKLLKAQNIDCLVLAGFLQLIPDFLVQQFPKRILNIHPALLPKFGGKGMYGLKVHEAVLAANESESGMTIHFVNEKYDEGEVLMQQTIKVDVGETAETLQLKIQQLEYEWYAKAIEELLA